MSPGKDEEGVVACMHEHDLRDGAVAAIPITMVYIAYGLPFGLLAAQSGLPWWAAMAMSLVVFAGTAQFLSLQLMAMTTGIVEIMIAVFFMNLRHAFFSTSLALRLPRVQGWRLFYLGFTNTDETYGVNMSQSALTPDRALGTNLVSHATWVGATCLGALLGSQLDHVAMLGGMLPILFAVLLALFLKTRRDALLAMVAAMLTYGLMALVEGTSAFLFTTVIVPTIAVMVWRDDD